MVLSRWRAGSGEGRELGAGAQRPSTRGAGGSRFLRARSAVRHVLLPSGILGAVLPSLARLLLGGATSGVAARSCLSRGTLAWAATLGSGALAAVTVAAPVTAADARRCRGDRRRSIAYNSTSCRRPWHLGGLLASPGLGRRRSRCRAADDSRGCDSLDRRHAAAISQRRRGRSRSGHSSGCLGAGMWLSRVGSTLAALASGGCTPLVAGRRRRLLLSRCVGCALALALSSIGLSYRLRRSVSFGTRLLLLLLRRGRCLCLGGRGGALLCLPLPRLPCLALALLT